MKVLKRVLIWVGGAFIVLLVIPAVIGGIIGAFDDEPTTVEAAQEQNIEGISTTAMATTALPPPTNGALKTSATTTTYPPQVSAASTPTPTTTTISAEWTASDLKAFGAVPNACVREWQKVQETDPTADGFTAVEDAYDACEARTVGAHWTWVTCDIYSDNSDRRETRRRIQVMLGVTSDGVWGPRTQRAWEERCGPPVTTTRPAPPAPSATTTTTSTVRLPAVPDPRYFRGLSCEEWDEQGYTQAQLQQMVIDAGFDFGWGVARDPNFDGEPCEPEVGHGYLPQRTTTTAARTTTTTPTRVDCDQLWQDIDRATDRAFEAGTEDAYDRVDEMIDDYLAAGCSY